MVQKIEADEEVPEKFKKLDGVPPLLFEKLNSADAPEFMRITQAAIADLYIKGLITIEGGYEQINKWRDLKQQRETWSDVIALKRTKNIEKINKEHILKLIVPYYRVSDGYMVYEKFLKWDEKIVDRATKKEHGTPLYYLDMINYSWDFKHDPRTHVRQFKYEAKERMDKLEIALHIPRYPEKHASFIRDQKKKGIMPFFDFYLGFRWRMS